MTQAEHRSWRQRACVAATYTTQSTVSGWVLIYAIVSIKNSLCVCITVYVFVCIWLVWKDSLVLVFIDHGKHLLLTAVLTVTSFTIHLFLHLPFTSHRWKDRYFSKHTLLVSLAITSRCLHTIATSIA
jgi:hypothetical protein